METKAETEIQCNTPWNLPVRKPFGKDMHFENLDFPVVF